MNLQRIELFEKAVEGCRHLIASQPFAHLPLRGAIAQLEYLSALERNEQSDRKQLKDITLGFIAVREIADFDPTVEALLSEANEQARRMLFENPEHQNAQQGVQRDGLASGGSAR